MVLQKILDAVLGGVAPATLVPEVDGNLADLARNLPGARLIHQPGQSVAQASGLAGNSGADEEAEHRQTNEQEKIDDRDGAAAAAHQFLQP